MAIWLINMFSLAILQFPNILLLFRVVRLMDSGEELVPLTSSRAMYRNKYKVLGNVLIVTIGSLLFGYCLSYFTAVPIISVMEIFNFRFECLGHAVGVIAGTTPVGASIGAFLSLKMSKHLSRKNSLIATSILVIVGTVLTLIETYPTLLIGRIIQGIAIGFYSVIVPVYINQICPVELSGIYGSLNQTLIVIGVLISTILGFIIPRSDNKNCIENRQIIPSDPQIIVKIKIIFAIPIAFAILQIILLKFFSYNETPRYLYSVGRDQEALQLIKQIYLEQYVQEIVRQKREQRIDSDLLDSGDEAQMFSSRARKLTYFVAFEIAVLQQTCGITIVALFGREILVRAHLTSETASIIQPTVIFAQLIGCSLSFIIIKKIGRKPLLQIGTGASFLLTTLTGMAFYFQQLIGTIVVGSLYLFMIIFGCTLGPTAWIYVPQVIPVKIVPYAIGTGWLTASISIIFFPMMFQSSDSSANGYVFFISSFFSFVLFFFNHKFLVQTKNKTKKQIKRSFQVIIQRQSTTQ